MQDNQLLGRILKIDYPWRIDRVELDEPSNRLDVHVALSGEHQRLKLWGPSASRCRRCHRELPDPGTLGHLTLRHIPLGETRTYLRVPVYDAAGCPDPQCVCVRAWGMSGLRFTHHMAELAIKTFRATKSYAETAKLLDVTIADAHEICDRAGVMVETAPAAGDTRFAAAVPVAVIEPASPATRTVAIPPESHPGWQSLINGEIPVETDVLALKMMLERVRMAIVRNPTSASRLAGAKILRQYFLKYQHLHRSELAQISGGQVAGGRAAESNRHLPDLTATVAPQGMTGVRGIPPESHRGWQLLIDGQLRVQPDALALQMMLERIRMTIARNPTSAARDAGAKILRQYFVKHQHRHRAEIAQLAAA
ncbi:MAG: hypothetical protein ACT4NU_13765 [Chromatiales bacterium]